MQKIWLCISIWGILVANSVYGQQSIEEVDDPYSLSLEQLMQIPINSASKKDETLFDAPLSSYSITRTEINKAGVTTIMEALRLAPGVIVRELTNGVYDIHIRGFDNVVGGGASIFKTNLATLVMIDNRPVFNHNLGGTFWETLPVDLIDVERIEVVRGPSAPLFGPNAVSGVINIITKRVKDALTINAQVVNTPGTDPNTSIAQGSVGAPLSSKLSFMLSGNFQNRNRYEDTYYVPSLLSYVPVEAIPNGRTRFPNHERALRKFGTNAFLTYKASEDVTVDFTLGLQESEVQKVFLASEDIPFTTNKSDSRYVNIAAKIKNLAIRTSYFKGYDDINVGRKPNAYDIDNIDINAEYTIHAAKNVTITPGVSYQDVIFSDKKYIIASDRKTGFINDEKSIHTLAGFIRTDIALTENWRAIGAVRADKFSSPDKTTIAYELASTYKVKDKHLIRAAITRSNSGAFGGINFANLELQPAPGYSFMNIGNTNHDFFTINMVELGYRVKLSNNLQLDMDVFRQTSRNYMATLVSKLAPSPPFPSNLPAEIQFQNVPTTATQHGVTISVNYVPTEKIQFKPFITFQRTEVYDLPTVFVSPDVLPNQPYTDRAHNQTPSFYGGYYFQYNVTSKFYVNLNGYYFKSHVVYDLTDPNAETTAGRIDGKLLVNAKVNYSPISNLNVFFTGRNILNSDSREFFGTDKIGGLYLVGLSYALN